MNISQYIVLGEASYLAQSLGFDDSFPTESGVRRRKKKKQFSNGDEDEDENTSSPENNLKINLFFAALDKCFIEKISTT